VKPIDEMEMAGDVLSGKRDVRDVLADLRRAAEQDERDRVLLDRTYTLTAHDIPLPLTGRQLLQNIADAEDAASPTEERPDHV
jgi:hypothetical protein